MAEDGESHSLGLFSPMCGAGASCDQPAGRNSLYPSPPLAVAQRKIAAKDMVGGPPLCVPQNIYDTKNVSAKHLDILMQASK